MNPIALVRRLTDGGMERNLADTLVEGILEVASAAEKGTPIQDSTPVARRLEEAGMEKHVAEGVARGIVKYCNSIAAERYGTAIPTPAADEKPAAR